MTWLIAIGLAVAAFAVAAFAFGVARSGWAILATALVLGLAGYASQASPDTPAAPAAGGTQGEAPAWSVVDDRKLMVGQAERSNSDKLLVADAFARRGRYADAAVILRGAVADDPRDGEAWLALGNALVEHADGALTPPALLAYRRAIAADPGGTGPGYFLGFALIRQGRFAEAREVWASTLAGARDDAAGRTELQQRLGRLDELIARAQAGQIPVPRQEAP